MERPGYNDKDKAKKWDEKDREIKSKKTKVERLG